MIGTSADIFLHHFDTRIKTFDLTNNMAFDLPNINIDGLRAHFKQWAPVTEADSVSAEDLGLPDLATENIRLRDIFIKYDDSANAMDTQFDIKSLVASVEEIDLNKEIVRIKDIALDESDSYVLFGKSPPKVDTDTSSAPVNWI